MALRPHDDLDTRREAEYLIQKLTKDERVAYLQWCCTECERLTNMPTRVAGNTLGEVREIWLDVCQLVVHHGLPLASALVELERRASQRKLFLP